MDVCLSINFQMVQVREFQIAENIHLICLLDLTADFGVKTNTKVDAALSASRERERERERDR